MGIPDLMRFVAGDAAGALRRIPATTSVEAGIPFDYVLVDLTNALQTVKLPVLLKLLGTQLAARTAVVLVVDGQRSRQGTAREQRQFLQQREADIAVQQIAQAIHEARGGSASAPATVKSAGLFGGQSAKKKNRAEAPTTSTAGSSTAPPRVVVCGRDVAGEGDYKLLSLHRRICQSHQQDHKPGSTAPTFAFVSEDADVLCGAMMGPAPQDVSVATTLHDALHEPHLLHVGSVLRRLYSTSGLVAAREMSAGDAPVDVPGQQPVDLNAVTAGAPKKMTFGDDDDDDTGAAPGKPAPGPGDANRIRRAKVQPQQEDVQGAALDFIFLFALVLGGSTTPAITRGATRVDAAACWQHYASILAGTAKTKSGRYLDKRATLLRFASSADASESPAGVFVDADLLSTVLEARFADDRSRVPTAEERKYARDFLRHLVRSTILLAVGAPDDTRRDAGVFDKPPAVSCLTAVLERHEERSYEVSFDFSLFPTTTGAGHGGSAAAALEPLRRLPCYIDDGSKRAAQAPGGANMFWPPHNARQLNSSASGGNARCRLSVAEVPLPLGATPTTLNKTLVELTTHYAASIAQSVYVGVKHTPLSDLAAAADAKAPVVAAAGSVEGMTWDFDMRRMVPATSRGTGDDANGEEVQRKQRAKQAILASAGLSASYFDAAAAQEARKEWDARGAELRMKRDAEKKLQEKQAQQQREEQEEKRAAAAAAAAAAGDDGKKKKKARLGKRERAKMAKKTGDDAPAAPKEKPAETSETAPATKKKRGPRKAKKAAAQEEASTRDE